MADAAAYPLVSIIMPVRNEAGFIARTLGAVLDQDYPPDRMEILIIDDGSTDDTRAVIAGLPGAERVRILDGPGGLVPRALNMGLRTARGDIVIRVDGHAAIAPDYVRRCVERLQSGEADNVGGRWIIRGKTPIEQAIAAAMTSPFGVGGAQWRHSTLPRETDTVPFGAYWREALLRLGGFDERLVRNQDYELNWRLRAAGGRILYDPAIYSIYHVKRDWRGLWRQYYQYGMWKARVIRMHPHSWRWRHLVAPAFVGGMIGSAVLAIVLRPARWLLAAGLLSYALAALIMAALTAARRGWRHLPRLPLIFAVLHISWGLGFWRGLFMPRLEPLPVPDRLYESQRGRDAASPPG